MRRGGFRRSSSFPGKARPFQQMQREMGKGKRKRTQPWVSRESSLKSPKGEVVALPRHQCGRWRCVERTEKSQVSKGSRLRGTIRAFKESFQGKLSESISELFGSCVSNFWLKVKKKILIKTQLKQDGHILFCQTT